MSARCPRCAGELLPDPQDDVPFCLACGYYAWPRVLTVAEVAGEFAGKQGSRYPAYHGIKLG